MDVVYIQQNDSLKSNTYCEHVNIYIFKTVSAMHM